MLPITKLAMTVVTALLVGEPQRPLWPTQIPEGEEPLVDLARLDPKFAFDLRYATSDNFFGKKAYPIAKCALRKSVAERMVRAQRWLDSHHAGLRLLFKDCYRPDSVQWLLWAAVKGTPKASYVANPEKPQGSMHSYGAAVDVTLAGAAGRELDMGTPYDFLGKQAEPRHEDRFVAEGVLRPEHVKNRKILRTAMVEAGMRPIPNEWWHFDAYVSDVVKKKYSRLDVPLESIP